MSRPLAGDGCGPAMVGRLPLRERVWARVLVARMQRELRIAACAHDGTNGTCPYCVRALAAGLPFPAQLPRAQSATPSTADHIPHTHTAGETP